MSPFTVSVVRYRQPIESVRFAVERCGGLAQAGAGTRVFIKPNIVFWTRATAFPKWGVITTSRVVEDMVRLLVERGVSDITIGEGMVTRDPTDVATPNHAFETLGYTALKQRYGVKVLNIFERPFEPVDLGDEICLNFNADILHSDLVVEVETEAGDQKTED